MKKFGGKLLMMFLLLAVVAWPQGAHNVTLTWIASAGDVSYNLYYSTAAAGPFTLITTTPITALTYVDTTHLSGYWELTALDANGDESIKVGPVTIPLAPTGFKAAGN